MVNPVDAQVYLDGIDYPIDRKNLVRYAKDHGADSEVLSALKSLPDKSYSDVAEISNELKIRDEINEALDDEDMGEGR